MSVSIIYVPSSRNWSGNPISYKLYSSIGAANPNYSFDIQIMFRRCDEASYREVYVMPYSQFNGYAEFDISSILDSLLEYDLPPLPISGLEINQPLYSKKATGLFYIKYREVSPDGFVELWTDVDIASPKIVVKGGISYEKWRGDNYWNNYFDVKKPFLTWQMNGRLAGIDERMYLSWLNLNTINAADVKLRCIVYYTDGYNQTVDFGCSAQRYDMIYFPAGAKQLGIDVLNTSKKLYKWSLQVVNINTLQQLTEEFTYEADNRPDYNKVCLNYRNSVGGIDSIRMRGVINYESDRKFSNIERISINRYYENVGLLPRIKNIQSTEWLQLKGNTGPLRKEEMDRLRDIHYNRECWMFMKYKWVPVLILTDSSKIKQSDSTIWTMDIHFAIASNGNNYYTPENVDL